MVHVLSDVLKPKYIYDFFSRSAVEKGHAYKAQGRVSELEISEDLTHIRAKVRGSSASKYRVDIQLDFGHDRLDALNGECSCPMTFNCKHVVATLLEALSGKPQPPNTASAGKQVELVPRAPPPLPYEINEWLEKFGTALRGDDYPAELNQRLLYCLEPSHDGVQTPVLEVSLRSVRVLKGGDFATNYAQPSVHDFAAERAPKYYRDSDIDILTQLSRRSSRYSYRKQPQPVELLQRIVATGRAFWLDHKRPPLRWGELREGRVEWRQASQRGVAPQLIVPGTIALNAEPPVYVDEAGGTIGPVELNLPPRLACQLLSAPAIPRAQVAEVSRRLGQALPERHHGLLPGTPAPAVGIDEDPVVILRLQRGHVSANGYYYGYKHEIDRPIAVAHLSFRYGPIEIEPSERATRLEAFHAGQVYSIARRPAKEKAARKRLSDLNFIGASAAFPSLDHRHARDLTLKQPVDWFDFLNLHAAELQAQGFEIRIDDDFPYRLATSSGEFDAEFESSGIDWFELALGVEIDGERRDLAPMLAALVAAPGFSPDQIKELAEAGDHFYLPLADGRHLSLAADRFLPLVLALHGLRLSGVLGGRVRQDQAVACRRRAAAGAGEREIRIPRRRQSSSSRGPLPASRLERCGAAERLSRRAPALPGARSGLARSAARERPGRGARRRYGARQDRTDFGVAGAGEGARQSRATCADRRADQPDDQLVQRGTEICAGSAGARAPRCRPQAEFCGDSRAMMWC